LASVLIVDKELALARDIASRLTHAIGGRTAGSTAVEVIAEADFSKARVRLKAKPPDVLVTALRLGKYNGLHLVHMGGAAGVPTRCIVHTDSLEPMQALEIRSAGAFYELRSRLHRALPAYVYAALPSQDRRDPIRFDRRTIARGGRRAADNHPPL
jgi:DNA-binding NarL/FixJ family response regulator